MRRPVELSANPITEPELGSIMPAPDFQKSPRRECGLHSGQNHEVTWILSSRSSSFKPDRASSAFVWP